MSDLYAEINALGAEINALTSEIQAYRRSRGLAPGEPAGLIPVTVSADYSAEITVYDDDTDTEVENPGQLYRMATS